MSALLVTAYTPTLDTGGPRRTFGVVGALAAHGPVEVLYVPFGGARPDPAYDQLEDVSLRPTTPSRGMGRALAYARSRAEGVPDVIARGVSLELARAATDRAAAHDRVVADGPVAAAALRRLSRRRPVIYLAHNFESGFRRNLSGNRRGSMRALRRFERGVLERSAESWMVSPIDMSSARALTPGAALRLVPNVLDVDAITPLAAPTGARHAIFVGDLTYEPNRNAVAWLQDTGMPALWERDPDIRLTVAGRGADRVHAKDARVRVAGFVPDLAALYAEAGCALVPLLQGGGSPLKFIEALAHGVPVVATPLAAAGLEAVAGEHYFEFAPDDSSFASVVPQALDPATAAPIASAARTLVEREYSIEALRVRVAP